eukprot:g734.t1
MAGGVHIAADEGSEPATPTGTTTLVRTRSYRVAPNLLAFDAAEQLEAEAAEAHGFDSRIKSLRRKTSRRHGRGGGDGGRARLERERPAPVEPRSARLTSAQAARSRTLSGWSPSSAGAAAGGGGGGGAGGVSGRSSSFTMFTDHHHHGDIAQLLAARRAVREFRHEDDQPPEPQTPRTALDEEEGEQSFEAVVSCSASLKIPTESDMESLRSVADVLEASVMEREMRIELLERLIVLGNKMSTV